MSVEEYYARRVERCQPFPLEGFVFEHKSEPLLPLADFAFRILRNFGIAMALIIGSLAIGMTGYRATEGLSWLDAFLNASMILTGMGR